MAGRAIVGPLAALTAGMLLGAGVHVVTGPASVGAIDSGAPDATVLSASEERDGGDPIGTAELRERVESAVLLADVKACGVVRQGTVTMVRTAAGPLGLTNSHVVRGAGTATLSGARLGVATAPVVGHLAGRDVARIDLDPLEPPSAAPLEVGEPVHLGDPVITVGFPAGRWTVQQGRVVSIGRRGGWGGSGVVMVVDVPAVEGTSGGAVVDASGRVVGLIAARDPRSGNTIAYPMRDVLAGAPVGEAVC